MIDFESLERAYQRHPPIDAAQRPLIRAVIAEIDAYQGDVIERGVHPLWLAIVALEQLQDRRETHGRAGQTTEMSRSGIPATYIASNLST